VETRNSAGIINRLTAVRFLTRRLDDTAREMG
jgi:hypothetical protein